MAWLIGPASLKFEYHVQRNARNQLGPGGSNLDDVVARGWYVSGTYIITGEDKPFNGPVVPQRPFSPFLDHMGPGAWEVGFNWYLNERVGACSTGELLVRKLAWDAV